MAHTLALDLPEETYVALARFAAEQGCTVEELGADWLAAAVDRLAQDPLSQLCGVVRSGAYDLMQDPHAPIADHLLEELTRLLRP